MMLLPEPPEDPSVQTIRAFRRAARVVVRAESLSLHERLADLARLAEEARQSESPAISQEAVWRESEGFIRGEPESVPPPLSDPMERRHQELRGQGRIKCPECLSRLLTDMEIEHRRQLRRQEIEEVIRREENLQ
jgi:hypothetical protein